MNVIILASLAIIVLAQCLNAANNPYKFAKRCNANTELCINLKCRRRGFHYSLPFSYHYLCCNGIIYDQKKHSCVRRRYGYYSFVTRVEKCDPCTQFKCDDGQCTLKEWKCNGVKDCLDGSDEVGCSPCRKNQFCCRTRIGYRSVCINRKRVCNKVADCRDGSDEAGCQNKRGFRCGPNSFRCQNDRCIPLNCVCDGYNNCGDKSDEFPGCVRLGKKRDEISGFADQLLQDGGQNALDVANGTVAD